MTILELGREAASVTEIERELTELRRRAAAQAHEAMLPARASVLNVVVYATRRAHAERAARTIEELALGHPSRALVLFHDLGAREPFAAEVSLHCNLPRVSGTNVCFEQIVVKARAGSDSRLASVVIPLLIPDLPVFLWWTGTPSFGAAYFRDLLRLARRLVVDSADFARPEVALPRLFDLVCEGRFGVTDLNWTRLTPWRELLAQFFDVPDWRPSLDAVTGLRAGFAVDMEGREVHPSQALLLVGWLAARLGWLTEEHLAPSEAGGLLFRMRRPDGERLWVRAQPRFVRSVDEGNVTFVRLQAGLGARRAEFAISCSLDGTPHVVTEVVLDGRPAMRRTVVLPRPSVVELLGEEFTITGSDAIYEEALSALCSLA